MLNQHTPSINDVGNWEGRGRVKNWSKLLMDSTIKTADIGEGGVKKPEKLPTSFMDGLLWLKLLPITDIDVVGLVYV